MGFPELDLEVNEGFGTISMNSKGWSTNFLNSKVKDPQFGLKPALDPLCVQFVTLRTEQGLIVLTGSTLE